MNRLRTVFFDLDGTLLDTAPDMAFTLNQLMLQHGLAEIPYNNIRATVSDGAKAMVSLGFKLDHSDPAFSALVDEFLTLYEKHATNATRPFQDMEMVLQFLDDHRLPWGIVTNKPSRFTFDILKSLDLEHRAACIVCGDTLTKRKPDPEPILHACHLLQKNPDECVYVGDSRFDVQASQSAGMPALVALYGYIKKEEDPFAWRADGYIRDAKEIISWLEKNPVAAVK